MEKSAILVVDMLKGFFTPNEKLPLPTRVKEIISTNHKVLRFARQAGIPIVFVNDNFQKSEVPLDRHLKLHGVHAVDGTEGGEILDELECNREKDLVVPKKLYDGFFNTRLDSLLRELGVKICVMTGVYTNACVQHTAMGAWCRCYDVVVLEDCCAGPDEQVHKSSLEYMKWLYGAEVISSEAWMAGVKSGK